MVGRLAAEAGESEADRIRHAFLLVYGRPPANLKLQIGLEFLGPSKPSKEEPASSGDSGIVEMGAVRPSTAERERIYVCH